MIMTVKPLGKLYCRAVAVAVALEVVLEAGLAAVWAKLALIQTKPKQVVKSELNSFIEWCDCRNPPNVLVFP